MKSRAEKRIYLFYFIVIAGAIISLIFTNISYDAEYQLAMAYRFVKGDKMITQMWEPHQTSAFLCAILMKIYITITGTTTGIVLYTQIMGLLIRGAIALWFMKVVKEWVGEKPALIIGVIYLLISPKEPVPAAISEKVKCDMAGGGGGQSVSGRFCISVCRALLFFRFFCSVGVL